MGPIFLAESQSRLYPHMRAKFGCDPTAGSKKRPFNFISRYSFNYYINMVYFYLYIKLRRSRDGAFVWSSIVRV